MYARMQMRWLIYSKLASCVRVTHSFKQAAPSVVCTNKNSVHDGEFQLISQQSSEMTPNSKTKLLIEIRDLLRTNLRSREEIQDMMEEDEDKKKEWKLAAAVIDRILFIIFGIMSVGGTAIFITVFAFAYRPVA